jgi:hypothetical protein
MLHASQGYLPLSANVGLSHRTYVDLGQNASLIIAKKQTMPVTRTIRKAKTDVSDPKVANPIRRKRTANPSRIGHAFVPVTKNGISQNL